MKKPRDSHLGFRMDKETHDKLFYIAEYEGRTGSGQILYLIRRCITEFEQVHGKIKPNVNSKTRISLKNFL